VAKRYLEEGAKGVVAFDIFEDRLAALQEELGDQVATIQGDVRNGNDNSAAVDLAVSRFGKLDVFVGNAGVRDARRRLDDLSDQELSDGFDEIFGINVKGYFLGAMASREALAHTKGCMIFTLSTSSFYVGGGSIYIASKHAALGMTRALANELAPDIRVNGVAPSGTPTSLTDAQSLAPAGQRSTTPRTGGPDTNLLQIQLEPEDHAAAYVLLASDQSRVMTGAVINTDGGRGVVSARIN
jgi:NAD(P)-dependent dehydrogenase (short-subunit alcohol dehydrogenase family)